MPLQSEQSRKAQAVRDTTMTTLPDGVIQANTFSQTDQRFSQVVLLEGGGAVVVWWDTGDFNPSNSGVRAQIFDADENPVGGEIAIDLPADAFVDGAPEVAPLSGGGFVVGWTALPSASNGGLAYSQLQVFTATGQPQGNPILLDNPTRYITDITLAPTASGGFLASWMESATDVPGSENGDVRAQFFDSTGTSISPSFVVNTGSDQDIRDPDITLLANGNYLITWLDPRLASDNSPEIVVRAQIIAADGSDVGGEFAPITNADGLNSTPRFAPLPDGGFAAVWVNNGVPNGPEGVVQLQMFNPDGTPRTGVFEVGNTLVATTEVVIAELDDGLIAVGYAATTSTNLEGELTLFVYDSDGTVISGPHFVNGIDGGLGLYFDIVGVDRDDIVVTWTEANPNQNSPTGNDDDIYVQSLELEAPGIVFVGTDQNERLVGTQWNDSILGASGFDTILGGLGDDTLNGEEQADSLVGADGDDSLIGGQGFDILEGDAGDDTLLAGDEPDRLYGGTGNDLLYGGSNFSITVDGLFGEEGNDTLYGQAGFDFLDGGEGDDLLDGGHQADNLFGREGNDTLRGDLGFDRLFGGVGDDFGRGGEGDDGLFGDQGNDTMYGEEGNDRLFGGPGNDYLDGGEGNDIFYAGAGFDTIVGGLGDDTMQGNFNADRFVFANGHGNDVIQDFDANNDFEKIDLSAVSAIVNFSDLIVNHSSQVGGNVLIDTGGGNSITLNGVTLADLDAVDFIF